MDTENISETKKQGAAVGGLRAAQDSPGVIIFPPLLLVGTLFTGLILQWVWPEHLHAPGWARMAVVPLILAGGGLMAWGRTIMVRAGTNVAPSKPALAIVRDGPFRFTRNPLYLGGTLVYLALGVTLDSGWLFALAAPMLLVLHFGIIRREERYLEAKFGEPYLAYKNSVRRWI